MNSYGTKIMNRNCARGTQLTSESCKMFISENLVASLDIRLMHSKFQYFMDFSNGRENGN